MCQWFQRKGTVRKMLAQEHKYQRNTDYKDVEESWKFRF